MNETIITSLFELCNRPNADLAEVEAFIIHNNATPEEVTHAAIRLADENTLEIHQFDYTEERKPSPDELVTTNWVALFEIFIKYGLLPNLVYTTDNINYYNIMQEIRHIDNGDVAPVIMRRLMECGGNPNLNIDGEQLFPALDFDIVFDVVELDNKRLFDIEFKIWLVMMGYGGYIKDHECPAKMKNGYTPEIFKKFEDFDYKIEWIPKDWIMHIFYKNSGEEVATL